MLSKHELLGLSVWDLDTGCQEVKLDLAPTAQGLGLGFSSALPQEFGCGRRQVLGRCGHDVGASPQPRKSGGLGSGVPVSPSSSLEWAITLMSRWIPFPSAPGQTRGCDWYAVSCLTNHPFAQHTLLRACFLPCPQLVGKTPSVAPTLIGLRRPVHMGPEGQGQVRDPGLEPGTREVRQ